VAARSAPTRVMHFFQTSAHNLLPASAALFIPRHEIVRQTCGDLLPRGRL
jgi:hypothetical protein